jgi:hypothetical protein
VWLVLRMGLQVIDQAGIEKSPIGQHARHFVMQVSVRSVLRNRCCCLGGCEPGDGILFAALSNFGRAIGDCDCY